MIRASERADRLLAVDMSYRHTRALEIFDDFGRRGVLVRAFAGRPEWLRLGLPAGEDEWSLLAERLKDVAA